MESCIHGPKVCPYLRGLKATIRLASATHCWSVETIPRSFSQCIFEDCTKQIKAVPSVLAW